MINMALVKKELKASWKMLLVFMAILSLYMGMIIYMYSPDLNDMMNSMMQAMPEVFSAVGMGQVGEGLIGFMVQYLYGFILILFPSIFMLMVASKCICRYVDTGSMAYLLASPNTRKKICFTQWFVLMTLILVLILYITTFSIVVAEVLFPKELDVMMFMQLNGSLFILYFFIASFFFFISCAVNETDKLFAISGGSLFLFYVFQAIANMGDKLEFFKYFTFFTLFNPAEITTNFSSQIIPLSILLVGGILLSGVGISIFSSKDLSL